MASAQARNVPIISAQQLLTWLDGRNASTVSNLTWNGTTLGFTVSADARARGLQLLIPAQQLTGLTRAGSPLAYTTTTIKGVSYAVFSATNASYQATYASDTTPPRYLVGRGQRHRHVCRGHVDDG